MADYTVQDLQDNLDYLNNTKQIIKQSIVNKGQSISDSDTFRSYADKISAIETGKGDVKLFETEEAMQADTKAEEGDLAIVYKNEVNNVTADSRFQYITFPETVTLPTAVATDSFCMLRAVDSSTMFDGQVNLNNTSFSFNGYSETGMIRVEYSSADGINYTRTRFEGDNGELTNPVDLGTEVLIYDVNSFTTDMGYFMQIDGSAFKGLYEYSSYIDKDNVYSVLVSDITFDYSSTDGITNMTWNGNKYSILNVPSILELYTKIKEDTGLDLMYVAIDENDNLILFDLKNYNYMCGDIAFDPNKNQLGICSPNDRDYALILSVATLDLESKTYTLNEYNSSGNVYVNVYKHNWSYFPIKLKTLTYTLNPSGRNKITCENYFVVGDTTTGDREVYVGNNSLIPGSLDSLFVVKYKYMLASTQLTLAASNELLPGKIAYGKNGVVTGDDTVYNNLDWEQIWSKYNLSQTDADDIRNTDATIPIITYNTNNEGESYIDASKDPLKSQNVVTDLTNTIVFGGRTYVEIEKGTILYLLANPTTKRLTIRKYMLQNDIVTISEYDELDYPNDNYISYSKFNPVDRCIYFLCNTKSTLWLYAYNIDTKVLTQKFAVSGNYQYITPNFCFDNNTLFIDSSTAGGFYKFTFSGTRTTIQSHTGYASIVSISDTYIAVKDGSNSRAKLYNMKTGQWTSITTETQSTFVLFDAPNDSVYLLENTTLRKIQNDEVVKTTNIDFTNCANDHLVFNTYSSKYKCDVDTVPTYKTEMIMPGLSVDTNTDIAYADDAIPDVMLVLHKNKRNICTIFGIVFKYIFIDVLTDGSGKYVAMGDGANTPQYTIMKAQMTKLEKDFELDDSPISQAEYNTALNTAKQIEGSE